MAGIPLTTAAVSSYACYRPELPFLTLPLPVCIRNSPAQLLPVPCPPQPQPLSPPTPAPTTFHRPNRTYEKAHHLLCESGIHTACVATLRFLLVLPCCGRSMGSYVAVFFSNAKLWYHMRCFDIGCFAHGCTALGRSDALVCAA